MNIGMLWFNNNPKTTTAEKIAKAAEYYKQKYGAVPTVCFINPAQGEAQVDGMTIRKSHQILPNHFWLGREE